MSIEAKQKNETGTTPVYLGRWVNQHGSELNIVALDGNRFTGEFKTGVGAHDPNEKFEATGYISDHLITFSVDFSGHGCLTSWAGQFTKADDSYQIDTLWHLSRALPEAHEKDSLWCGIWTGSDLFSRVKDEDEHRDLTLFNRPVAAPSYPFKITHK